MMEMFDLENMRVGDLIEYYFKNEKKEHTAHRDEIIEFVRSSRTCSISCWSTSDFHELRPPKIVNMNI